MKTWWGSLDPALREAGRIALIGMPLGYLLWLALGVTAILLGVPMEVTGVGGGWSAVSLLCGLVGAGGAYKASVRLEKRRTAKGGNRE